MTLQNLLTIGFVLAMIANAIAFVRHWMMMRALQICLNGLIESQRMFAELEKTRHLPESERAAAIERQLYRPYRS